MPDENRGINYQEDIYSDVRVGDDEYGSGQANTNTTPEQGGNSYVVDANIDRLLKDMNGSTAVRCFGGTLFRSEDEYGGSVVAFAVKNEDREYLNEQATWYNSWNAGQINQILRFDEAHTVGEYAIFTFNIPQDAVSLRQKIQQDNKFSEQGVNVFAHLVQFLKGYDDIMYCNGYVPLCCFSLDTIFLTEKRDEMDLYVLPLRASGCQYPAYYPGEVYADNADRSSDLFISALVCVQILSGQEYEDAGMRMSRCITLESVEKCLSIFPSWRPTLSEVLGEIEVAGIDSVVRPTGGRTPVSHTVKDKDIEVNINKPDSDIEPSEQEKFISNLSIVRFFKNIGETFKNLMHRIGLGVERIKEPEAEKKGTAVPNPKKRKKIDIPK